MRRLKGKYFLALSCFSNPKVKKKGYEQQSGGSLIHYSTCQAPSRKPCQRRDSPGTLDCRRPLATICCRPRAMDQKPRATKFSRCRSRRILIAACPRIFGRSYRRPHGQQRRTAFPQGGQELLPLPVEHLGLCPGILTGLRGVVKTSRFFVNAVNIDVSAPQKR